MLDQIPAVQSVQNACFLRRSFQKDFQNYGRSRLHQDAGTDQKQMEEHTKDIQRRQAEQLEKWTAAGQLSIL